MTTVGVSLRGSSKAVAKAAANDSSPPQSRTKLSATRTDFSRHRAHRVAVQDDPSGGGLGFEHRPFRNLAVPLHERRNGTATLDDDLEEFPHRIGDRAVMTVDEQAVAFFVALFSVPRQMYFADVLDREIREIVERGPT